MLFRSVRAHVPWSATPPREIPPRPLAVVSPAAFSVVDRLGFPGSNCFSGLNSHGPHARPPTHQPRCRHPDCKAGYRPAGLGFSRAGLAPAGRQTEFPKSPHHSLLSDQHCLVASNDATTKIIPPRLLCGRPPGGQFKIDPLCSFPQAHIN